jgi:hypothetical protein
VTVPLDVQAALQFRRAQPPGSVHLVGGDQFVVGQVDVQTRGVRLDDTVVPAQEPPQRLAGGLCLDVPQRGVERPDRAEDDAGVAGLEGLAQHAVVEGDHRPRILAVQRREDGVGLHVRSQADARDPLVGLDDHDRHRHGAVGVDAVGVADRPAPVLHRRQCPVSGDPHVSLSSSRR